MKRIYIHDEQKNELPDHVFNHHEVGSCKAVWPEIKTNKEGRPYEETNTVDITIGSREIHQRLTPTTLGKSDTYWIKVWPENRWIRLTNEYSIAPAEKDDDHAG